MKRTLTLAALCAGFGGLTALAQDPVGDAFNRIDASGDGAISQAEFVAYQLQNGRVSERIARQQFGQLSGPDGLISIEEFRAGPQRPVAVQPRPQRSARQAPPRRRPRQGYGS